VADPLSLSPEDFCPYVGLQPFTVRDQAYFFGREKEQRVISANLFAAPLTILYGPSAVGKSSVLQAGVASHLASEPRTAVVYFASWQGDDYLPRLKAECRRAISAALTGELAVDDSLPLDEWIVGAVAQFRGALLLMLDQFEEYLLYHREEDEHALDAALARVVNRQDVSAHVLIGLRDDSLSKLNRFSRRIPNLLGNTLQLRRLSPEAARRAITGPIERYTADHPGGRRTIIDEPLVNRIIADVQIENVVASVSGGIGGVHASEDRGRIETAFLQLVLTELWRAASARPGERRLNAETLDALGGAKAIVRSHVDRELQKLGEVGREIAAKLFLHLVTPSGAKYALRTEDLVELAGRPRDQVTSVLTSLSSARLLRRLDPPERYEIFHDAFAVALLEWRKGYLQAQLQQEALRVAEARRREEFKELARRRRWQALIAFVILLLSGFTVYLVHERRDKAELAANLEIAETSAAKSAAAKEAALIAKKQAEAEKRAGEDTIAAKELALQAERARLGGDTAKATLLRAQQADKQLSANLAKKQADQYSQQSTAKLDEATQKQLRLDDLVKDAGAKGYSVSTLGNAAAQAAPTPGPPDTGAPAAEPPTAVEPSTAESGPPAPGNTPVGGDFRDPYRKAIAAKDQKRWKDAQAFLETALARNPRDTGEVINISGFGNVEPYLPHFYLGSVLHSQDKCADALKQFDLSEQDDAIKKTRLYKSLQQQRSACENKK
jgi:hypothetical protein